MSRPTYNGIRDLHPIFNNERIMQSFKLKNLLIKLHLKENKCEKCLIDTWCDSPIKVELHHKDGNPLNNNLENLSFLCPNCHTYTDNFCRRKSSRKDIPDEEFKVIIQDSFTLKEVAAKTKTRDSGQSHYKIKNFMLKHNIYLKKSSVTTKSHPFVKQFNCVKERIAYIAKKNEKANWPSDENLKKIVWEKSVSSLGKELEITDNAIRHRCQRRKIAVPPVGYWRKLETGRIQECEELKRCAIENAQKNGREEGSRTHT